jgi:hypothetical protein
VENAQKNVAKLDQITQTGAMQEKQVWDKLTSGIGSAFSTAFEGVIKGTQTLKQTMINLAQSIADVFLKVGEQIAMKWIEAQLFGSAGAVAAKKTEAAGVIPTEAGIAAGGAAEAVASIPYVGPAMAVGAAGQIFAMVMGYGAAAMSAAGGYDVPVGINPFTQLHAEEMVLPAELANAVRGGAQGGRGASAGSISNQTFHINAIGPKDVAAAVKQAFRMGHR